MVFNFLLQSSSRAVLCLAGGSQKSSDSQSPMLQKVDKRTTSPMMSTKTKIARNHPSSTCGATNSPHQKKLKFHLAKERKASATLGIIMSAFIICWLPFFVLALVRPFLENPNSVPQFLSSLFLWLGYCNSLLNPIIYATLNKDFRKPFRQMLNLRFTNLNHAMREEFYQSQYGNPISNYETKAREMKDFKRLKKKGLEEIDITPSGPNESFL